LAGCTHITCQEECTKITCRANHTILPQEAATPEANLSSLSDLKAQLQQQLADLEKQEQAATESLKPHTTGQIDQLMQKLQDAMDELKAQRVELAKKEQQAAPAAPATPDKPASNK